MKEIGPNSISRGMAASVTVLDADGQIPENMALHEEFLVCYDCAKTIGTLMLLF